MAIDAPAIARASLDPRWVSFGRVRLLDRVVDFVREGVLRSLHVKQGLREDTELWSRLATDP